ncbi:response regulator [Anaerofustis sp. LCP19S3_F7]|uniref:response regulator n=1 Tax=Anaerofustis sp. LCP19S3_F7 TaxID=3440247 RepID=UPI003F8ECFE4
MNNMVLVIEDDNAIKNLIAATLESKDYKFHTAKNGKQALDEAISLKPDVILLDLGLPDMDGVDIIKNVRTWYNVPIIVVSARSEDKDKIDALDAGADDYLTKPFSVDELLARLRVAFRRLDYQNHHFSRTEEAVFINGSLKIDYASGCVYVDDNEVHLTPNEYKLICLLSNNVGKVLTHKYILNEIWGSAFDSDVASLRVYMATLRKKIEKDTEHPEYIQTHIGIGYRMLRIEQ